MVFTISFQSFPQKDTTIVNALTKNIVTVVDDVNGTNVTVGNNKGIEVITDNDGDTTRIRIGNRIFNVIEEDSGSKTQINITVEDKEEIERNPKMRGLYGGIGYGFNLFHTEDYNLYNGLGYGNFMDLHHTKSIAFNINFADFTFSDNNNIIGIVTGLGLSFMDFRFNEPVTITNENNLIVPQQLDPIGLKKSKLNVSYITVPLMLQIKTPFQLNRSHLYIAGGVIGGVNIGSHTKIKHETGKVKERGNFNINEFKYDLTARIGFRDICFFANYSMTPLFKEGEGPELYPLTIGISFPNF